MLRSISASKWNSGTSILWRGNNYSSYNKEFIRSINKKKIENNTSNIFLFESARVSIYHLLKFLNIGEGDDVQVLGFTCDAVTDSIKALNCETTLYDCKMNLKAINLRIKKNTKAVICQVTFGIESISKTLALDLKKKGIFVIYDKALSYGQSDFIESEKTECADFYIMSFESSKSFTIGWGGALKINSERYEDEFRKYYMKLNRLSFLNDFFRCISTSLNLYMCRKGNIMYATIWYLLRSVGLIRQSKYSSKQSARNNPRIGLISEKIFHNLKFKIPQYLQKSNENHELIKKKLEENGFDVISRVNYDNSCARVAFLASPDQKMIINQIFKKNYIELGYWFNNLPMKYEINKLPNIKSLMKKIINIPCHWTLTNQELNLILECIDMTNKDEYKK